MCFAIPLSCVRCVSFFVHVKDLKSYKVHAKDSYSLPQKTLTCLNILVIVQPFLHLLGGGMYDRTTSSSVISDHSAQRSLVNQCEQKHSNFSCVCFKNQRQSLHLFPSAEDVKTQ